MQNLTHNMTDIDNPMIAISTLFICEWLIYNLKYTLFQIKILGIKIIQKKEKNLPDECQILSSLCFDAEKL